MADSEDLAMSPKSMTDDALTRQVLPATTGYSLIIDNEQQSHSKPNVMVQGEHVRGVHTKTVVEVENTKGEEAQPGSAGPILQPTAVEDTTPK